MSIIDCPECGIQVSDKAIACPKCAYPVAAMNDSPTGCSSSNPSAATTKIWPLEIDGAHVNIVKTPNKWAGYHLSTDEDKLYAQGQGISVLVATVGSMKGIYVKNNSVFLVTDPAEIEIYFLGKNPGHGWAQVIAKSLHLKLPAYSIETESESTKESNDSNPGNSNNTMGQQATGCSVAVFMVILFIAGYAALGYKSSDGGSSVDSTVSARSSRYTESSGVHVRWYEGGTLHKSYVREWKSASRRNRLATSADFVTALLRGESLPFPGADAIRPAAEGIDECILTAASGGSAGVKSDSASSMKSSEAAALCWMLMKSKL